MINWISLNNLFHVEFHVILHLKALGFLKNIFIQQESRIKDEIILKEQANEAIWWSNTVHTAYVHSCRMKNEGNFQLCVSFQLAMVI